MKTENRYNHKKLIEWGTKVLESYEFSKEDSFSTAKVLVEADLRGIFSHGIAGDSSLDTIYEKIKGDQIVVGTKPIFIKQKYPTIIHIDANGGLGHAVSVSAVNLVKDIARKYGMGKVYVFNSSHFGAAGVYSEMISEDSDLIGIVTCTAPAWSIPFIEKNNYAGTKRRLGTNPIAWSIPYKNGIITIDMATTQRAVSPAIVVAYENEEIIKKKGIDINKIKQEKGAHPELREIPVDYMIGPNNEKVVYPFNREYGGKCSASLLGGENFGYKGSGLCVNIELDTIVGGERIKCRPARSRGIESRIGHTFEAYAIDSLYSKDEILSRLTENIEDIKEYGGPNMLFAGEKEAKLKKEFLKRGILYSNGQIGRLKKMGEISGISFPENK